MTAIICNYFLVTPVLVVAKRLIISKMLIILGAKWNEDFQKVAEY
jgi:hypothetical protein